MHLPETTPLWELVALARSGWPIESQYLELEDDLGIDHFEGRSYRGWLHHAVAERPSLPTVRTWVREIFGLLLIIHNRRMLGMLETRPYKGAASRKPD